MTERSSPIDLSHVAVIIPALNEQESLRHLLPLLGSMSLGRILVCDNGSTDRTREVTQQFGAEWIFAPKRGYGSACYAGMQHLAPQIAVVAFLDADLSDDPALLPQIVEPILSDQADFVMGTRVPNLREPGSMTWPQRVGNRLLPLMLKVGWGHGYTDLGPFRAVRRTSLEAIDMKDRAYGWTIEMQIRAVELGLRIREVPVPYRRRRGRSKISGTVRGVVLATYWILRTCCVMWLTRRRRLRHVPAA